MKGTTKKRIIRLLGKFDIQSYKGVKEIILAIRDGRSNKQIERYLNYIFPDKTQRVYFEECSKLKYDSSSLESFKIRFGEQGKKMFEEKLQKTLQSLDGFKQRYGEHLGAKKYEQFVSKVKDHSSKDYFIEKYGSEYYAELCDKKRVTKERFLLSHTLEEWDELCKKKVNNEENFKKRYGDSWEEKFESYKRNSIMYGDDKKPNQVKYWEKKGFSKSQANLIIKSVQRKFSLDICIEKYGLEEGTRVFEERQKKWRESLDRKSKREIDLINRKKGISKKGIPHAGLITEKWFQKGDNKKILGFLYYYKFTNIRTQETFYKIGITRNIENRWGIHHGEYFIEKLFEKKDNYYNCFRKEQQFLEKYKQYRVTPSGDIGTEYFSENVINEGEFYEDN